MHDWKIDWAYAVLPDCGNPLYKIDQCLYCGQKIIVESALKEWDKSPEVQTMDCFICRGKDTLRYMVSRYNGHKHGVCIACGMRFME